EAAYPRPMTGAGIDYDERSLSLINLYVGGWRDADKDVIHWLWKLTPIHDQLAVEFQDVRGFFCRMLFRCFSTLPHNVKKENSALKCIESIGPSLTNEVHWPSCRGWRTRYVHLLITHEPFS